MSNATATRSLFPDSATNAGGKMRFLVVLISILALAMGAGVGDDRSAEAHDRSGATDGEGCAAALDLHVPVDRLGAAGGDDFVD